MILIRKSFYYVLWLALDCRAHRFIQENERTIIRKLTLKLNKQLNLDFWNRYITYHILSSKCITVNMDILAYLSYTVYTNITDDCICMPWWRHHLNVVSGEFRVYLHWFMPLFNAISCNIQSKMLVWEYYMIEQNTNVILLFESFMTRTHTFTDN